MLTQLFRNRILAPHPSNSTMCRATSTVKAVTADHPIGNQERWSSLAFSLLISLIVHAIVAENFAYRTDDDSEIPGEARSSTGLLARLAQAEPQPYLRPAPSISRLSEHAEVEPVTSGTVAPMPEDSTEESPYAPPESVEQMASIIAPPDLPLPLDSFSPSGFMRIKVFVNEDGLADSVELLESNFAEDYVSTIVRLFKSAKFSPGVSSGKAIKSWRIVEIDYSPS